MKAELLILLALLWEIRRNDKYLWRDVYKNISYCCDESSDTALKICSSMDAYSQFSDYIADYSKQLISANTPYNRM